MPGGWAARGRIRKRAGKHPSGRWDPYRQARPHRPGAGPAVTGATSFTVTPAAADHLLFLQQPTDTAAGQTLSPVTVAVVDQYGNVETDDTSDTVTLSLDTNPSGGTLSGTLTLTVVNGVATFSDLSIDLAGAGYTLHASLGGDLPDMDSNPFTITM